MVELGFKLHSVYTTLYLVYLMARQDFEEKKIKREVVDTELTSVLRDWKF